MIFLVYLFMTNDRNNAATMVFALMGSTLFVLGFMYIILSFSVKEMDPAPMALALKNQVDEVLPKNNQCNENNRVVDGFQS